MTKSLFQFLRKIWSLCRAVPPVRRRGGPSGCAFGVEGPRGFLEVARFRRMPGPWRFRAGKRVWARAVIDLGPWQMIVYRRDDEMRPDEIARALEIGPPDFLLGDDFDAENGAGASDELRGLAAENADSEGLPACPFCGGELCAVVLEGGVPGVSCGGCGAYTSRLPWREPWLYEGRAS